MNWPQFTSRPSSLVIRYLETIMSTLDDLTTSVAALTTVDTAEKAAIDALVALVGTLQPGVLTAVQQAALDNANTALAGLAAVDAAATTEIDATLPPKP